MTTQTGAHYQLFDRAYSHLNETLFIPRRSELPGALIVMTRKPRRMLGYYQHNVWTTSDESTAGEQDTFLAEIGLHSEHLSRPPMDTLSTLCHEMLHQWQYCYGTPSRTGYHNREWSDAMVEYGLEPSSTGEPGGKRTGQNVSHYVVKGGPFWTSAQKLLQGGWQTEFHAITYAQLQRRVTRVKYTCECSACWGKPGMELLCMKCSEIMAEAG